MSESEQEVQQSAPEPAATEAPSAPAPQQGWSGPSQEEWQQTQQALSYIASMFQEPEQQHQQDDDGEVDIDAYIQHAVDSRLQPVRPLLDATVKERGEKEMQNIFNEMKAEVGDFDTKLAERTATSFLAEYGGDPVEATKAGARYAAEVRKSERTAGESSYKERLQRGPAGYEAPVDGGGTKTRPKPKTYEEVTAMWAGETEA